MKLFKRIMAVMLLAMTTSGVMAAVDLDDLSNNIKYKDNIKYKEVMRPLKCEETTHHGKNYLVFRIDPGLVEPLEKLDISRFTDHRTLGLLKSVKDLYKMLEKDAGGGTDKLKEKLYQLYRQNNDVKIALSYDFSADEISSIMLDNPLNQDVLCQLRMDVSDDRNKIYENYAARNSFVRKLLEELKMKGVEVPDLYDLTKETADPLIKNLVEAAVAKKEAVHSEPKK
ncbi:MAG: hypothetical protein K2W94_05235 [Alphaproteobacteria bacterium]|nr:hypothetical protein [Alphaproteobacteria bacterium]